ncbi:condensation domain-containing protein [Streptomyces doebereineriae]|uniref:Condensation domain-containing protein n=1 Tax=Streptomyces doebereineriae TaxID=3075528 RepID=A0ABU2VB20_9ACTN|nr:condensation domain-containing protein [Streptomyces sp. DSM 41640]MDT0482747.1 condensation domain-containing protein [Streptomyces sp. DSM 41640]
MRPATLTAEQRELLDRLLDRRLPAAAHSRISPYSGDRGAMPLSSAQQRIWFFNQLQPEATLYNVAGAARLRGRLDAELLHRCLGEIVDRHEVLRTTYGQVNGVPVQAVRPFAAIELPLVDLTDLPAGTRETEARRRCQAETDRPFDLERDLMLRPVLLRLAADEHLLLICQHHIATDGWSLNVLIRELGERYSAHLRGDTPNLPELPIQYGDFAAWQHEWMNESAVGRQLDYWREQLAETRLVDIATGLPRPAELTWNGGTLQYRIAPEIVRRITDLAEAERATPYMALIAAQSVVLSRWSGQHDIVIGCAVAGRRHAELEHLAGCFVNEVAMRMNTSGAPTYRDLVRQARDVCLGAYDHQDVPFERIVEVVGPERDTLARVPLVRHQLGFHNEPRSSVEMPELSISIEALSNNTARFDLEVDLSPADDGGITGTVYFATDVFTEDIVLRMLDSLRTVLDGAGKDPDVPATCLPVVGERELTLLRDASDVRPVRADARATVPALVEEQARLRPDAVAVRHRDGDLTFRDLDERANRLSWWLRDLGVTPGQPVAVCMPPSGHLVVSLLAVLKAGGTAVPLNPRHPVSDINEVLLDCSTGLVLLDGEGPDGLDHMVGSVDVTADLARWPADSPAAAPAPEQAAFVNYVHAPDGTPRGLVNTHAGVAHRLRWAAATWLDGGGEDGGEHTALSTGAGFDLSPWEFLWAPAAGAALAIADSDEPAALAGTLSRAAVTVLRCAPSELAALLDADEVPAALRQVVLRDERPWPALTVRLRAVAPGCRVHLQYGPAHAALDIIAQRFEAESRPDVLTSAAGPPESGATLRILDQAGLPVPIGVPGELWLGGAPLPQGYLGRPHENHLLLADDPLREGAARLIRTHQRVRRLPDGTLDPLGDDIRVRTHRVEPSEVEAVLHGASGVERAMLTARPGDEQPGLIAHVSLCTEDDPDSGITDRARFAEIYSTRAAEDDPTLNAGGWNSPHTGEYLTAAEMREWADTTFRQILALEPAHVLEIGCKTGGLLFRLAPRCTSYTGTDLSAYALQHIRDHRDWLASKVDDVELLERAADDYDGLAAGSFDTVVLNSVIQYFPSARYLERVLDGAVRLLRPGGHIYLGSVRSLPLLGALHLPGQLDRFQTTDPAGPLCQALTARVGQEQELALDPRYFTHLAERMSGVGEVHLLPRLGRHRNELGAYRYDVVLRVGEQVPPGVADLTLDWQTDGLTSYAVTELLRERAPRRVLLAAVPDSRVHTRLRAFSDLMAGRTSTVSDTAAALAPRRAEPGGAVDPHLFAGLAEKAGYTALVQCAENASDGTVQVLLTRAEVTGTSQASPAELLPSGFGSRVAAGTTTAPQDTLYNDPLTVTRERAAVTRLRRHLQQRLPAHAVPDHVLLVPGFPTGRAGAADPAALPDPDLAAAAAEAYREPSTETESRLTVIWSAALGVDRVSVHDDFFALGGHSLLGSEVMDTVRQEYSVDVPLGLLFESPTIAAVAAYVDEQLAKPSEAVAPIQRADRSALRRRRGAAPAASALSKENS